MLPPLSLALSVCRITKITGWIAERSGGRVGKGITRWILAWILTTFALHLGDICFCNTKQYFWWEHSGVCRRGISGWTVRQGEKFNWRVLVVKSDKCKGHYDFTSLYCVILAVRLNSTRFKGTTHRDFSSTRCCFLLVVFPPQLQPPCFQ